LRKFTVAPVIAFALSIPFLTATYTAQAQGSPPCKAPAEFSRLDYPLVRTAHRLAAGEPVTIVAIGSSSTAGDGASSPAHTYPARLEAELQLRFPGGRITVLNRGVGGEDARQMLARFDQAVVAEKPDLVLWQVGTNAVLRDHALDGEAPLLREGIARLKAIKTDIVLLDSQYAPKVLAKQDIYGMLDLMRSIASEEKLGLFRRFAIMQHWNEVENISFQTSLSPDGLHMNDWSYGCIAKLLGNALTDAVRTPAVASASPRN
jgi:acyl-CoA thioesterase I